MHQNRSLVSPGPRGAEWEVSGCGAITWGDSMNCSYCWFGPLHSHDLPPSPPQPGWPSSSYPHVHVFSCQWGLCQSQKWLNSLWSPNPSLHLPPSSHQGIILPSPSQASKLLALPESSSAVLFLPRVTSSRPGPESFHPEPWTTLALLKGHYFTRSCRIFRVSSVSQAGEVLSKQDHKARHSAPSTVEDNMFMLDFKSVRTIGTDSTIELGAMVKICMYWNFNRAFGFKKKF